MVRYTLLSEGGSDRALMPIIDWLLYQYFPDVSIQGRWAELRSLPHPPRGLTARIQTAIELEPCDILFVHRDSNSAGPELRRLEIVDAFDRVILQEQSLPRLLPVVPIRMTEAWLLADENALRTAAGNPTGTMPLAIPNINELESLLNPKDLLHELLRTAIGLSARRRQKSPVGRWVHRLAELIQDFAPLRQLSGFRKLEEDVRCFAEQS